MVEIELSLLGAFDRPVALRKTVLAHVGGSLRAFGSRVSLLLANTASALENTGLRAIGLGMTSLKIDVSI